MALREIERQPAKRLKSYQLADVDNLFRWLQNAMNIIKQLKPGLTRLKTEGTLKIYQIRK